MSSPDASPHSDATRTDIAVLDRAAKRICGEAPHATLSLIGANLSPDVVVRRQDVAINIAEHRADHLFVPDVTARPWALHVEYVTQPDPRQHINWYYKNGCFNKQLNIPVPLAVIYLEKGNYTTFHTGCTIEAGGISTQFTWHTSYLWLRVDEIRYGGLKELAPLLPLCFDHPTVEILEEQKAIIQSLDVGDERRAEMIAVALMVDRRKFGESVLEGIFREEKAMLKEMSFVKEWMAEERQEGRGEGLAIGALIGRIEFAGQLLGRNVPGRAQLQEMPMETLQALDVELQQELRR